MRYAINLADLLARKNELPLMLLVRPVISETSEKVQVNQDAMDSTAVILDCDEERAKAICDLIRDKYKRHHLRLYRSRHTSWERI